MEFPKMLYKASEQFADCAALKDGLAAGMVQTLVVKNAGEQKAAKGFTEDLASLIKAAQ